MYEFSDYFHVFVERHSDIIASLLKHLQISGIAILLGCIVAIPLGVFLAKTSIGWIKSLVFTITNIFQTIPSLAMLAIFIPLIGIGMKPAIVALFLYSLMPILRNTYAAFESIDPGIIESAKGMGYNAMQRMIHVEVPIAMPYIMSGVRLTMVYIINWATLAGLIGAGGLGQLIIGGMGVNNKPLIFAAAIMAMVLALVADFVFAKFENLFKKKENRKQIPIQMEESV
ncbi:MAG TPA: ABC transporter permease [Virgibacillus sp.]|nr:ABC transporter permease [Virgibacillus sp.]